MKRQRLFLLKASTALGTLFIFAICNAYEIGMRALPHEDKGYYFTTSDGGSLIGEYERNHERLTALALQCLYEANNSEGTLEKMPEDCTDYKSIDTELSLFSNELTPSDAPYLNIGTLYLLCDGQMIQYDSSTKAGPLPQHLGL